MTYLKKPRPSSARRATLWPLALALCALTFAACDDGKPEHGEGGEEELITTVTAVLTPASGGTPTILTFRDLDGDGGDEPMIEGGTLAARTEYTVSIGFLNEAESPAEDVTAEIRAEDEEHQVFVLPEGSLDASYAYADSDADNFPVGLLGQLITGQASSGDLRVVLRHEPDKGATGVAAGILENAGGETDVEVRFPVTIQ